MTDYFTSIIQRFISNEPVIQPLYRSGFEQPDILIRDFFSYQGEYPDNRKRETTTQKNALEIPEDKSETSIINPPVRTKPAKDEKGMDKGTNQMGSSKTVDLPETNLHKIKMNISSQTHSYKKLKSEAQAFPARKRQVGDNKIISDSCQSGAKSFDDEHRTTEVETEQAVNLTLNNRVNSSTKISDFRPLIPLKKMSITKPSHGESLQDKIKGLSSTDMQNMQESISHYKSKHNSLEPAETGTKTPSITVSIGSVEIKNNVQSPRTSPRIKKSEPVLSLDQYLKRRNSE